MFRSSGDLSAFCVLPFYMGHLLFDKVYTFPLPRARLRIPKLPVRGYEPSDSEDDGADPRAPTLARTLRGERVVARQGSTVFKHVSVGRELSVCLLHTEVSFRLPPLKLGEAVRQGGPRHLRLGRRLPLPLAHLACASPARPRPSSRPCAGC
eukprot:scaffold96709_cov48-Phaeocystis_antarctica.AAC.1